MKKLKTSLLSIFIFIGINSLHAQTVDEIIDKYVEAAGGKDVIGKINTIYMESNVHKMGKLQLDIGGPLYNYKEKGVKVELQGQEKVGDVNAYKLKVSTQDSNEVTYYIDPNTYHIIQASI